MAEAAKASRLDFGGEPTECPNCEEASLVKDYQTSEIICSNCGLVVRERSLDRGPEWRTFDQEQRESRSRGGAPMTPAIHDKGLSTEIDYRNQDSSGRGIPSAKRAQMYRMRKWQQRARVSDAKDRNLTIALSELNRMSSRLRLPREIEEVASVLYRDAVHKGLIRGRSIEGVVSAALYAACRQCNVPRTLEEIAEVSSVDRKEIGRSYRFISRELDFRLTPVDPVRYVERFGSELDLSGETRTEAIELIKKAKEKKLTSGRGPTGIAAAAIYVAGIITGEKRTQADVAETAQVTEVTVRSRYTELVEKLGIPIDKKEGGTLVYRKELAREKAKRKKLREKDVKAKDVKCVNAVASVVFEDTEFDLRELAEALDAEYKPNGFPGISYSPEDMEATFLIFEPGKANCVGAPSPGKAREASKFLARELKEKGFEVDPDPEVEIRNMVIQADFGVPIDLEGLSNSPHDTSYNPESFPGIQLALDDPDVNFLIFATGRGVLHVGREEDVGPALERAEEILREFAVGVPLDKKTRKATEWLEKKARVRQAAEAR